jgi:uncharacterized membrane protein YjgN (DUF898 family)
VRTERYFYANTQLAGSSFEYLAEPLAILKGRLIAYAVVIALALSARFAIVWYFALILALFALMPWIIVLSLRFRARNSAWRGLPLRFVQSGGNAYGPFMGWQILQVISGTLLYPLMKKRQHEFVAQGHRFGRKHFDFNGDAGAYYVPYAIAAGAGIVLVIAFAVAIGAVAVVGDAGAGKAPTPGTGVIVAMLGFYLVFFALAVFLRVRYTNLLWNNTSLGAHRFESNLRARDMMWLYASNIVAIVCTIGLAVPWAMVRLARYRAEHFVAATSGSIEDFLADAQGAQDATGAELVDALDLGADFGF